MSKTVASDTTTITVVVDQSIIDQLRHQTKESVRDHPTLSGREPRLDNWQVVPFAISRAVEQQFGPGWSVEYPVMNDPWSSDDSLAILIPPGRLVSMDKGSRVRIPDELRTKYWARESYEVGDKLSEVLRIELQVPTNPQTY